MWGIASTVTSAKSQNSPHMLILTHWAVLLKTHMVINRQEWDRAIAGATKPVPFCSAHWSAQGWSRNCFTSRIKWAGTLSRVVMCHTVAFHLHKANTALRFLFNIHFILNILWIARVSATATKLFENVPQFLHIPPPLFLPSLPKYFTDIQAVFLLLLKSTQTKQRVSRSLGMFFTQCFYAWVLHMHEKLKQEASPMN